MSDPEVRKQVDESITDAVACAQGSVDSGVQIPSVYLEAVLGLLPSDFLISHVQIDTNGNDFDVFLGARTYMRRIQTVRLETQNVSQGSIGDFAPTVAMKMPQIKAHMKDYGYVLEKCTLLQCVTLMYDCDFSQVGIR
jgi:hypothetical protein